MVLLPRRIVKQSYQILAGGFSSVAYALGCFVPLVIVIVVVLFALFLGMTVMMQFGTAKDLDRDRIPDTSNLMP